jgi:predicted DCC family thiol-disulfide oxidoreductase YuxK
LKQKLPNNPIVFFDGECGLCSKSVQFIIKYDKNQTFYFCPLQASITKNLIPEKFHNANTVILFEEKKIYVKSLAAFKILSKLKTNWRILLIFRLFPLFLTDAIYSLVAKYRKRFFKSPATCQLPTPELLNRIL